MLRTEKFDKRVGKVHIPVAEAVAVESPADFTPDPGGPLPPIPIPPFPIDPSLPFPFPEPLPPWRRTCRTKLKQGCYTLSFVPKGSNPFLGTRYRGTLRVEHVNTTVRFSGDLYARGPLIIWPLPRLPIGRTDRLRMAQEMDGDPAADAPGVIPVYSRQSYHSYLKGTSAQLVKIVPIFVQCSFTLTFDEFRYQHPATGFSGTFPATPTRTIRFVLSPTGTPDSYSGKAYEGATELGNVSMSFVSDSFRKATLVIHRLEGAERPPVSVSGPGGTTEDFRSVFATAGWDLTVVDGGEVPLPPALVGVQDPNQCWPSQNSATLMGSVPGYNPADLDSVWRAHLLAVPARLGCARGRMFDNGAGDANNIPREGAVTHSHDGYPLGDSPNFGVAQDRQQREFPRAFLRSASHEVGHTFNQIHQDFEGGSDNSIMTVTPSVADVLAAGGQTFPDDINLGVNATVRRHLAHLPDPAVRPGAMEFFGGAVNAPEADQVAWPPTLVCTLRADDDNLRLGEPLTLTWTLTNKGNEPALVPTKLDVQSLVARVSATDADGKVIFFRPVDQHTCVRNPLRELEAGQSLEGSTTVFWGRDGFPLERPGRHTVEVILLWQVNGANVGAEAAITVWVAYPTGPEENRVASLMFHAEVGRAVATGVVPARGLAEKNLAEVVKLGEKQPVAAKLSKMNLKTAAPPK